MKKCGKKKKCASNTMNNEPFLFKKENVITVHYSAKLFYKRNTHTQCMKSLFTTGDKT